MKVLLIGMGSIGRRHAEILLEHFHHELFALRSGVSAQPLPPELRQIKEVTSWEAALALGAEVAFIMNPTAVHVATAMRCAQAGMHLFIEKPLSDSLQGVDELIGICQQKRLTAYVAYCLRFHPVILKMQELLNGRKIHHVRARCTSYLHQWRKGSDPLKSYSARRSDGGGVILDLSHEFDFLQFLFGPVEKISGVWGRAGDVTIDTEDFCDALIRWSSGLHGSVHLNFMSHLNERIVHVDFEGGYLSADLIESRIVWQSEAGLETIRLENDRNAYLRRQTQYFFDHLGDLHILNNLSEAKELLVKILEFRNG